MESDCEIQVAGAFVYSFIYVSPLFILWLCGMDCGKVSMVFLVETCLEKNTFCFYVKCFCRDAFRKLLEPKYFGNIFQIFKIIFWIYITTYCASFCD